MQCRMFEAISSTTEKNDSDNKRKQEQKLQWKPSEVTEQRQRSYTIVCTQDRGREKKWKMKKTKTELRGVNSYHLRDNNFIVCMPVCLFQMWYNVFIHCPLQLYCFSFRFPFFHFLSAQLPSLLLQWMLYNLLSAHTHTFVSLDFVLIHFLFVRKRMKITLTMSCCLAR